MALKDLKTRRFRPNDTKGVDIESIISAPLIAASVANSMMARDQAKFIMDFCFTKDGDSYQPVMIELSITNSVIDPEERENGVVVKPQGIKQISTRFHLPLLTIIPISSLAVDSVSLQFELELVSQEQVEESYSKAFNLLGAPKEKKVQLKGKVSYDSKERNESTGHKNSQTQNSSSIKVNVNASQLPLPVGMSTILDMYAKSIHPIPEPTTNQSNQENQGES